MAARTSGPRPVAAHDRAGIQSVFAYCRSMRVTESLRGFPSQCCKPGKAGVPGSRSRVKDVEVAFLFERVWKTLPAAWLEHLLPFKHHFEIAIIIHSFLLLNTA